MHKETNRSDSVVEENNSPAIKNGRGFFKEFVSFVLFALIVVLPIRIFIAQPFIVSGASMDPTFESGQYLIVDQISYRFNDPERGDVIIFKYPKDKSKFFIKRIIGLPGEKVSVINGRVFVSQGEVSEEREVEEDYVVNKTFDNLNLNLEDGEYFVMGDNRPASLDSRSWGALEKDLIRGKALIRLLPISKVGIFPGSVTNAP